MNAISGRRTLHRLIYASEIAIAESDQDHEIGLIIRTSIRNNRQASLTGLLLVHAGWFVQVLEGPAEAVMSTYQRIRDDSRHCETTMLTSGPVTTREFAEWNMCAARLAPTDDAIIEALSKRSAFNPAILSASSAMRLLKAVRGIQRGSPATELIG